MNKKFVLVTGISSGLGKATAEAAMAAGHYLIGTFRRQAQVDEFNSSHTGDAQAFRLDLADSASILALMQDVHREFGRLDVLVNNAGIGFAGAIEETSPQEMQLVFQVNFFGTIALTQLCLPIMRQQGQGHIVQISSHAGIKGFAGFGAYSASKFALEGASDALAAELEPLGIRVTVVEPGPFRTHFAGTSLGFAVQEIADYAATAGAFRARLRAVDGQQEGDPKKAAAAIMGLIAAEHPPMRLPLGKIALNTISTKLSQVSDDVERAREIASLAVY